MLLDRHAVADLQAEIARGPPDLLPDLSVVEVEDHGIGPAVQAGHVGRYSVGRASAETVPERPVGRGTLTVARFNWRCR